MINWESEYREADELLREVWQYMIRYDLENTDIFKKVGDFLGFNEDD